MTEIVDKKYWTDGWWCRNLDEAKQKAEAIGCNRISYTPDKPHNLKLTAVHMFGRWWTNRFVVGAVDNND